MQTDDEAYGLRIYLDENYNQEWGGTNILNLENLLWKEKDDRWEYAPLIVYLENTGPVTIEVEAKGHPSPSSVKPGWGVSSDTITIAPGERAPLLLELTHHIFFDVANPMIYFFSEPIYLIETNWDWTIFIGYAIILILAATWLLHQKGRSFAWLLLSLSGIGVIILLCLENKRALDETDLNIE